jgi:hypothetical protein
MNVGDLKRMLADVPDDTQLVVPGSDHSYRRIRYIRLEVAGTCQDGYLGEFFPDLPNGGGWEPMPDKVVEVLVFG